jgi:FMN-dependent NADH-azoreductase
MSTLLHIDASPRSDRSVSRQLTREFAVTWKEAHPDGQIIYRDLGHNPVPLVTELLSRQFTRRRRCDRQNCELPFRRRIN